MATVTSEAMPSSFINNAQRVLRQSDPAKTRELPLHSTTVDALHAYARRRDDTFRMRKSDAFFLTRRATALSYQRVARTFRELGKDVEYHLISSSYGHDAFLLEHETFAPLVNSFLERVAREGHD